MRRTEPSDRVATLWEMAWNNERLSCVVFRGTDGLRLSIESRTAIIVSERFTMQPRVVARVRALRDSLRRRGWYDIAGLTSAYPGDDPPGP